MAVDCGIADGHRGRYYFDRKISYYPGDDRIDSPIYGGDELEIDLPGRFFKAGDNSLVLTAVQDSDNAGVSSSLIRCVAPLGEHRSEASGVRDNQTHSFR